MAQPPRTKPERSHRSAKDQRGYRRLVFGCSWYRRAAIPGAKEDYSNSNYAVLGRIIETVSGQSYSAFMRANIFQPLAMKDSGVDTGQAQIENEAVGYALDGADVAPAAYVNMSTCFGAGAIYSTV